MKRILLILIVSLFAANFTWAAALKVQPAEIEIEVVRGVLAEEELMIENPGDNVALFEVYPDNFSDWIKVRPESFTLEQGEKQKVVLEIKNQEAGVFSTMISVVAKPLSGRKFQANSGIKIPLEVRISKAKTSMFLASLYPFRFSIHLMSAVIILLLILGLVKYRYAKNG